MAVEQETEAFRFLVLWPVWRDAYESIFCRLATK